MWAWLATETARLLLTGKVLLAALLGVRNLRLEPWRELLLVLLLWRHPHASRKRLVLRWWSMRGHGQRGRVWL